jgi:undecaprenyl-diphosphatase
MSQLDMLMRHGLSKRLVLRRFMRLVVTLGLAVMFAELVKDVWFREGLVWDAPLMLAIHHLSRPWLDTVMRAATLMGGLGAIAVAALVAAWLCRKQKYTSALTIVVSLSGAAALNELMKILLKRPRPVLFPPLVVERGFGFPSGHVTASAAVYGFLAVLLWRNNRRGWAIFAAAWVFVVAVSRIYLGVHYPSDVLGAMSLTSLWLMVVLAVHDWHLRQPK